MVVLAFGSLRYEGDSQCCVDSEPGSPWKAEAYRKSKTRDCGPSGKTHDEVEFQVSFGVEDLYWKMVGWEGYLRGRWEAASPPTWEGIP